MIPEAFFVNSPGEEDSLMADSVPEMASYNEFPYTHHTITSSNNFCGIFMIIRYKVPKRVC